MKQPLRQRLQQLLRKPQDRLQKLLDRRPDRISEPATGLHPVRIRDLEIVQPPAQTSGQEIVLHPVRISDQETDRPDRVTGHSVRVTDPPAADPEIGLPEADPEIGLAEADLEIGPLAADLEIVRQEDVRERGLLAENRQESLQQPNRLR